MSNKMTEMRSEHNSQNGTSKNHRHSHRSSQKHGHRSSQNNHRSSQHYSRSSHHQHQVLNPFELYMATRSDIMVRIGKDPEKPVNAQPNFWVGDVLAGKISQNRNYVRMRVLSNGYKQWVPLKYDNKNQVLRVFPPKMKTFNYIEIGRSTNYKVKILAKSIWEAIESNYQIKMVPDICYNIVEYIPFMFPILSVCSTFFRGRGAYTQFSVPFFHKKDHAVQYFHRCIKEHYDLKKFSKDLRKKANIDFSTKKKSSKNKPEFDPDDPEYLREKKLREMYKDRMGPMNSDDENDENENKNENNNENNQNQDVNVNTNTNDTDDNDVKMDDDFTMTNHSLENNNNMTNNDNTNDNTNDNNINNEIGQNTNTAAFDPNTLDNRNDIDNDISNIWLDDSAEIEEEKRREEERLDREYMESILHTKKGVLPVWISNIYDNFKNRHYTKQDSKSSILFSDLIYYNCELYTMPNDHSINFDFEKGEYLEQNYHKDYMIESDTFDRKFKEPIKLVAVKWANKLNKLIDINDAPGSRWFETTFDQKDSTCDVYGQEEKLIIFVGGNWQGAKSRHYLQLTDEINNVPIDALPLVLINACVSCKYFKFDDDNNNINQIQSQSQNHIHKPNNSHNNHTHQNGHHHQNGQHNHSSHNSHKTTHNSNDGNNNNNNHTNT